MPVFSSIFRARCRAPFRSRRTARRTSHWWGQCIRLAVPGSATKIADPGGFRPPCVGSFVTFHSPRWDGYWLGASVRLSLSFGHPSLGRRYLMPAAVSSSAISPPR